MPYRYTRRHYAQRYARRNYAQRYRRRNYAARGFFPGFFFSLFR
jgi:hypothetical protein